MERFTRASSLDAAINEGVKTIHRTSSVDFMLPHYSLYRDIEHVVSANGSKAANDWKIPIDESNFSIAQINQYFMKSPEKWEKKFTTIGCIAQMVEANITKCATRTMWKTSLSFAC